MGYFEKFGYPEIIFFVSKMILFEIIVGASLLMLVSASRINGEATERNAQMLQANTTDEFLQTKLDALEQKIKGEITTAKTELETKMLLNTLMLKEYEFCQFGETNKNNTSVKTYRNGTHAVAALGGRKKMVNFDHQEHSITFPRAFHKRPGLAFVADCSAPDAHLLTSCNPSKQHEEGKGFDVQLDKRRAYTKGARFWLVPAGMDIYRHYPKDCTIGCNMVFPQSLEIHWMACGN